MKKIISVLTVVIMLCMTTFSVAAAVASPSKGTIAQRGTVVTKDGEVIEIDNPDELSKYLHVEDTNKIQAQNIEGYFAVSVFEATLKNITSAEAILYVPGIKATDKIIVRKYVNGQWVDVEAEVVGDNLIKVSLTESTYIEVLKLDTSNKGDNNSGDNNNPGNNGSGTTIKPGTTTKPGTSTTKPGAATTKPGTTSSTSTVTKPNTSKKAPKTGEGNAFPVACIALAGCMTGVAICSTKMRKKTR